MQTYVDLVSQIGEPVCGITSVAFSVSGRLLFAGYDDFECKVRNFNRDIFISSSDSIFLYHTKLSYRFGMFFVVIALAPYKVMTTV